MKKTALLRALCYILPGIAIIYHYKNLLPYVAYTVASVMFLYGADIFCTMLYRKEKLSGSTKLFQSLNLFLFSGIMATIGSKNFVTTCTIWAVWSIAREGVEISEKVYHGNNKVIGFLNFAESVIMIYLSIDLIAEPTEHNALLHILLLGVELILEILFPVLDHIFSDEKNPDGELEKSFLHDKNNFE